jgi:hypothetical protein
VEAERIESCQSNVGTWGDEDDPRTVTTAVHMMPQDLNFNRGNWLQVENAAASCGALPDHQIFYLARAEYGRDGSASGERRR